MGKSQHITIGICPSLLVTATRAFWFAIRIDSPIRFGRINSFCSTISHSIRPLHSPAQWSHAHSLILRRCISHSAVQLTLLTLLNIYWLVLLSLWSCESDSWWRSRIDISKLSSYGISKTIITWIQDFLTARKFRVRVNLSHSTWSDVTSGIPHRAVF